MTSHYNPNQLSHVPFKLGHIFHSITWSFLLLRIHWKYLLCLEYPNNCHLHLPKFYPNSNSSLYATSSLGLWPPSPTPNLYVIFPSLAYNSTWYGKHHIATWILASCAITRCVNCQRTGSVKGKDRDLLIFVFITALYNLTHSAYTMNYLWR